MQAFPMFEVVAVLLFVRTSHCHGGPGIPSLRAYTSSSYYYSDYSFPKHQQKNKYLPGPQNCPETGRTICEHVDNYPADDIYRVVSSTKSHRFNFSSVFGDEREGDASPNLNQPTEQRGVHQHDGYVVYQTSVHYDYHLPTHAPWLYGHLPPSRPLPVSSYRRGRGRRNEDEDGLCPVIEKPLLPRVGLNDQSVWKFIVNVPEKDSSIHQRILVEICRSEGGECSSTLQLPLGYVSRCKQKYIKKKMLVINEDGRTLSMNNMFVPSCCVCQISRNNN